MIISNVSNNLNNYHYRAIVNGSNSTCTETSLQAVLYVVPAGIEEHPADISCNIFPNPSKGDFSVQIPANGFSVKTAEVYNISGQKIYIQEVTPANSASKNIHIALTCPMGFYFLKLTDATGTNILYRKLVIQ
ncbi:T9SS type A sorting domain-containing protein [Chitinophagaceae bacterium MMS25-I14]